MQVGTVHVPEVQSPSAPQAAPGSQLGAQAGGWHVPEQTADPQSPLTTQAAPSVHTGEHAGTGTQVTCTPVTLLAPMVPLSFVTVQYAAGPVGGAATVTA